jgi:hypothetical protein
MLQDICDYVPEAKRVLPGKKNFLPFKREKGKAKNGE